MTTFPQWHSRFSTILTRFALRLKATRYITATPTTFCRSQLILLVRSKARLHSYQKKLTLADALPFPPFSQLRSAPFWYKRSSPKFKLPACWKSYTVHLLVVPRFRSWKSDSLFLAQFIFPICWADATLYRNPNLLYTSSKLPPPSPGLWRQLWTLIRNDLHLFVAVISSTILGALINLLLPSIMGQLVTVISKSLTTHPRLVSNAASSSTISYLFSTFIDLYKALEPLNKPALKLLGLFVAKGLLTCTHISIMSQLGENLAYQLRLQLFDSLIHQDIVYFDSHQSSELIHLLTSDIHEFKHSFKQCLTNGLRATAEMTGSLTHLLHLSPILTTTLATTMPILYLIGTLYGSFLRRLSVHVKQIESCTLGPASESIINIRTVKSYTAENREVDRLSQSTKKSSTSNQHLGMHIGIFQGITSTSIGSMVLLVLYIGGAQVVQGTMEPGDLMTYLLATQATQKSLAAIGVLTSQLMKAHASALRIFQHMGSRPPATCDIGLELPNLDGNLRFNKIQFSYPTRPEVCVLNNFNLEIPAGKVVALCGASGSGKSTITSLLERFYDPAHGSITVDGVELRDLDIKWWRDQVGYLAQQPVLFCSSIRDNIRYGRPDATDKEIEDAAKLANAHEFISLFPDGYDTVVGERGASLSGGQSQRVAIAAAILKDPKILILDEATSALDTQSERLVQDALDKMMKNRTVLIIAHRLSTIRNADLIVVMGKPGGTIMEIGTHDQLLAKKGVYYQLHGTAGMQSPLG